MEQLPSLVSLISRHLASKVVLVSNSVILDLVCLFSQMDDRIVEVRVTRGSSWLSGRLDSSRRSREDVWILGI